MSIFLAGLLIFFPLFLGINVRIFNCIDNLLRALLLIVVSLIVSTLSKNISKKEKKLKESEQRLREFNIELELKVVDRTKKVKKSEEKCFEAYTRVNFYKDLFTHDINNIINNIKLSVELFSQYYNNPEKLKDMKEILEIIREQAIRGEKLSNDIQKLSQLEEVEISLKLIEVCKVLKDAIKFTYKSFPNRNINIQIDSID